MFINFSHSLDHEIFRVAWLNHWTNIIDIKCILQVVDVMNPVRFVMMRIVKYTKATVVREVVVINVSQVRYQMNEAMNSVTDDTVTEKIDQSIKGSIIDLFKWKII